MREISRKEADEQARTYAREMIGFLNASNSESSSSNHPRTEPAKLEGEFQRLYMLHMAQNFVIIP